MIATSITNTDLHGNANGFTLIEVLVVLTIMALVAAIAANAWRGTSPMAVRRDMQQIRKLMQDARSGAISQGKAVEVEVKDLPVGYSLSPGQAAVLRWYPDGSAAPAAIVNGQRVVLAVDMITGLPEEKP